MFEMPVNKEYHLQQPAGRLFQEESNSSCSVKSETIKRLKQRGWLEVWLDLCNSFSYNNNGNGNRGLYCTSLYGKGTGWEWSRKTAAEHPLCQGMRLSRCECVSVPACGELWGTEKAGNFGAGIIKTMPVS